MLATLVTVLAQRGTQEPPDEGSGILLILLGAAIALAIFATVFFVFIRGSRRRRQEGPPDSPHRPGSVGH